MAAPAFGLMQLPGFGIAQGDLRYLKLDASNSPVTGALNIQGALTLGVPTGGFIFSGGVSLQSAAGTNSNIQAVGDGAGSNVITRRYSADATGSQWQQAKARGSAAAPGVVLTNDGIFSQIGQAYDGATFRNVFNQFVSVVAATPSATDLESRFTLALVPAASITNTEIFRIQHASGLSMFGANIVVDANRVYRNRIFTVATLPAGVAGMRTVVNDALAPVFGAAVAGGGAVTVPVYYTGAAWFVG